MKEKQIRVLFKTGIFFLTGIIATVACPNPLESAAQAAETKKLPLVVIAHPEVKDSVLTENDVKSIMLGKKTKWSDKTAVHFVTLKEGAIHKAFLKLYVRKTESQFKMYWKKQVFSGKGKSPKAFKTEKEMVAYVAKTKGALGYISKKTADAEETKKLKIKTLEVKKKR